MIHMKSLKFRSAIDVGSCVVLAVPVVILPLFFYLKGPREIIDVLIASLLLLFFIVMYFSLQYTISTQELKVKMFFTTTVIPVQNITSIEKTSVLLSAPAFGITTRILVKYNTYDEVIISPKNQALFIKTLCQYNPDIILKNIENV